MEHPIDRDMRLAIEFDDYVEERVQRQKTSQEEKSFLFAKNNPALTERGVELNLSEGLEP